MKWLSRLRPTRRLGFMALGLVVAWLGGSLLVVHVLTSRPHALFAEPAPVVSWGKLEEHRLRTSDGETLGAWLRRGPAEGVSVLVLHGHRGCRRDGLPAAEFFAERGCSVLLVSLRAHGDSTGDLNDIGYSSRKDVIAAVEFLERERPGRPIVIDGVSMGAAAAIFAAGDLGERVSAYILESPYRDLHQAVSNRLASRLPPLVDRLAYAGVALVGPLKLPDVDRIAPIDHIERIPRRVPVLLLGGAKDPCATPAEVEELHGRIKGHARVVFFEQARHESLIRADRATFASAVEPLLREVAKD